MSLFDDLFVDQEQEYNDIAVNNVGRNWKNHLLITGWKEDWANDKSPLKIGDLTFYYSDYSFQQTSQYLYTQKDDFFCLEYRFADDDDPNVIIKKLINNCLVFFSNDINVALIYENEGKVVYYYQSFFDKKSKKKIEDLKHRISQLKYEEKDPPSNKPFFKDIINQYIRPWLKRLVDDIKNLAPAVYSNLTMSEKDYLVVIPALIQANVSYKAVIVCDLLVEHIKQAINENNNKVLSDDRAALNAYVDYIKKIIKTGGFTNITVPVLDYDALMPYRKELRHYPTNVNKLDFDKINGIDSLIELFGNNHAAFIEKVLSESFFLAPELESDRFLELSKELGNVAIARYSEAYKSYFPNMNKKQIINLSQGQYISIVLDGTTYNVKLDKDGNDYLRQYINEKTGYRVNSEFIGYKISHIWGQAIDPRYFSSFWNVVLVPAWANDLLDKDCCSSSLISKMVGTFKEICINLYDMNNKPWKQIGLSSMPLATEPVVHGLYQIHVIKAKQPNYKFGVICTSTVNI